MLLFVMVSNCHLYSKYYDFIYVLHFNTVCLSMFWVKASGSDKQYKSCDAIMKEQRSDKQYKSYGAIVKE